MREAEALFDEHHFHLPPFAYWSPEEWSNKGAECDEIRDNMLGWYITDFGLGDYEDTGLLMFTIRNGNPDLSRYSKPYAEKILVTKEQQVTPLHFHWNKMEDIINRSGGNVIVAVHNSTEDGKLADTDVTVAVDGRTKTVAAGTRIRLEPGESITIPPGMYHQFWSEQGHGTTLIGEVSKVNDDETDNRWLNRDEIDLFLDLEEDEEPLYYLCNEYPSPDS